MVMVTKTKKSKTEQHHQFKAGKKYSWNVPRLISLSRSLPVFNISISDIGEVDSIYWFDQDNQPTCRSIIEHTRKILRADLSKPVILSENGLVMDGMHRICKAILDGKSTVTAVQFAKDPEPDSISC